MTTIFQSSPSSATWRSMQFEPIIAARLAALDAHIAALKVRDHRHRYRPAFAKQALAIIRIYTLERSLQLNPDKTEVTATLHEPAEVRPVYYCTNLGTFRFTDPVSGTSVGVERLLNPGDIDFTWMRPPHSQPLYPEMSDDEADIP